MKLNNTARAAFEKRYRIDENETPEGMCQRVADFIADDQFQSDSFFKMMNEQKFLPNTPCLVNAGKPNPQMSACFVIPIEDSMESIFKAASDAAKIFKSGGGVGFSFSNLRPSDDIVGTTNGVSSGPVSFMEIFNTITEVVKQGGCRRGAMMGVLSVEHPDIEKFIDAKLNGTSLTNFNISVAMTDRFMADVEDGINTDSFPLINPRTKEVSKKINPTKLFNRICENAWKNGDPGLIFIDEINRFNPTPEYGKIESTNPCVVGDTFVLTAFGWRRISELVDKGTKISLDARFVDDKDSLVVPVKPYKTSDDSEIIKIRTNFGYEIRCTKDHKFFVRMNDKYLKVSHPVLKVGDTIPIADVGHVSVVSDSKVTGMVRGLGFMAAFLNAFREKCFVETYNKKTDTAEPAICFDFERKLVEYNEFKQYIIMSAYQLMKKAIKFKIYPMNKNIQDYVTTARGRRKGLAKVTSTTIYRILDELFGINHLTANTISDKLFRAHPKVQIEYIRALLEFTGEVKDDEIVFRSSSEDFVKKLQIMFLNFGIMTCREHTKYIKLKQDGVHIFEARFPVYELSVLGPNIERFVKRINFMQPRREFYMYKLRKVIKDNADLEPDFNDEIVSIETDGYEPTYCLTNPNGNSMVVNGITTGNCGESPLLPYESCCLGSINLAKFVNDGVIDFCELRSVVNQGIDFLYNLLMKNTYPLPEIDKASKLTKKLGLGVMGYADMLIKMRIRYGSPEAIKLGRDIMSFISGAAREHANTQQYESATLTSIAPTGTISIFANCSSGIEPVFSYVMTRTILDGTKFYEVHPAIQELNLTQEQLDFVAANGITQADFIPEDLRNVLVTASDVPPDQHLDTLAAFQVFVDLGVSKTINLPTSATVDSIASIYRAAWRKGCKGITVYRDGSRQDQVLSGTIKPMAQSSEKSEWSCHSDNVMEKRPKVLSGKTSKIRTAEGSFYLTINGDDTKPFEIFATPNSKSKEGAVNAEAISRLCSVALRFGVPVNAICHQLDKVRNQSLLSLPQNISAALKEYNSSGVKETFHCPECNGSLTREEGCMKCYSCGWSKCGG